MSDSEDQEQEQEEVKQESQEDSLNETLTFLSQQLEEKCNLKTTNMYGGQGGFGLVLFVYDILDQSKKYAVKAQSIINPNNGLLNQQALKLCKDEAKVMRDCKHKNIVEIHDDFVLGFYHFIQMSLCSQSLNDWIQKNKQSFIQDLKFLHFASQIIDGIEYLHNLDYVLRDVSVRNILLTTEGVLQLCDFGLAKKYDSELRSKVMYTSHLQGVLFYFPPEIHQALTDNKNQIKQTKEGDIWALGVCLSLLGGTPIQHFQNPNQKGFKIEDAPNISAKANELIRSILIKNPASRPHFKQIRENIQRIFLQEESFIKVGDEKTSNNFLKQQETIKVDSFQPSLPSLQAGSGEISGIETAVLILDNAEIAKNIINISESMNSMKDSTTAIEFNFFDESLLQKQTYILSQRPNDIQCLIRIGHIEIKLNCNYEQGESYLSRVISLQSNSIDSYLGICESLLLQSRNNSFSRIQEYITICLKYNPTYWRISYIEAWNFLKQLNYTKSKQSIIYAERQHDKNPLIISLKALVLCSNIEKQDDIQQARILIDQAISLNKTNDPIILFRAGYIYSQFLNEPLLGQNYYTRALEIAPKYQIALSNLILLLNQQNKSQEVEKWKQVILKEYSNSSLTYEVLGRIEKESEKKLEYFQKSIELDPYSLSSLYQISSIKKSEKKIDEAKDIFMQMLKINPDDSRIYIELGYICMQQNEKENAINHFKTALNNENCAQNVKKLLNGIIFELNGSDQQALWLYEESIKANPYQEEAYKRQMRILEKNKQAHNIQQLIQINLQAIEHNPNSEELKEQIVQHYLYNKDSQNALLYLTKLILQNPNRKGVYEQMAYIEQQFHNNHTQALQYYLQESKISGSQTISTNIAKIYCQKGDYSAAQAYITSVLEQNPNSIEAMFAQGMVYTKQKLIDKAILKYQEILEKEPKHVWSCFELGIIYKTEMNDNITALQMYERGLSIDPTISFIHFNVAIIYFELKNFDRAEWYLKQFLSVNFNHAKANYELGRLYLCKNEIPMSIYYLQHSIQCDPKFADALYTLSIAFQRDGKKGEALRTLYSIRTNFPDRQDALFDLAMLELSELKRENSYKLFQQYLLNDPFNEVVLKKMKEIKPQEMKINFKTNFFKEKETYQKYVILKQQQILFPTDLEVLQHLIQIHIELKQQKEAFAACNELLQLTPKSSLGNAYFMFGQVFSELYNDLEKAKIQYEKALKHNEESSEFYLKFGKLCMDLNLIEKAVTYLKKSTRRDPLYPIAYYYLGAISYNNFKTYKDAIKYLNKCISQQYQEPKVFFLLGKSFEKLNYLYQAKQSFEKVLQLDPYFENAEKCRQFINQNPNPECVLYKDQCTIF